MDLGQIGFEKAQAMMPYLRAMLRNVEREIDSTQETRNCDSVAYNSVMSGARSTNEGRPCTTQKETADRQRLVQNSGKSDVESNWTADSVIDGSVAPSEDTILTSFSELSTISGNSLMQPIYSWKDLRDILLAITKRTTFRRWVQIFADCGYFPPQVTLNDFYTICLRECPVTGKVHEFHESRRCIRCEVQLCQKCECWLLKRCELTPTEPLNDCKEMSQKESLAAKRIWPACQSNQYHRRLIVDLDQDCRCTEFLVNTIHNCENGKYHLCNDCYANALVLLCQPNSRIVATEKDCQVLNHVEYSCRCGAAGNVTQPAVCKICLRYCHFHCLDEADKKACREREKGWNQGSCSWVLKSIDTSLAAWRVVKTYRCYLEGSDSEAADSEESAEYIANQTA